MSRWTPPWAEMLNWIESEVDHAARRYRLSADHRDELRQTLCLRVLESVSRFDPADGRATLETWVRRQAAWGIADYWRDRLRRERREPLVDDPEDVDTEGDSPLRRAMRGELRDALRSCVEKLTPLQKERFLACESAIGTREPLRVVAERLGIARDTLKEAVERARIALRRCLEAAGFQPTRLAVAPPKSPGDPV